MFKTLARLASGLIVSGSASAAIVQVDIVGTVDFTVMTGGEFGGIPVGTPTTMSFQVDSDAFLDGSFPTRGYPLLPGSFNLTVGAASAGLANPYPAGQTPYFVLRNNDPAVDGFFLASHPDVAQDNGVWTDSPASIEPTFRALFKATYGGTTLSSLDILDAVGTYDFTGLTVFNWGLEDASFQPIGFIFDQFTISAVPAPSVAALVLLAPLGARRRRR